MSTLTGFSYEDEYSKKELKIGLESMKSQTLEISLTGNYMLNEEIPLNSTSFVISISDGKILFNNQAYDKLSFISQGKNNRIKIKNGLKAHTYLGSMEFKANGETILPINTLGLEDYIKGVVPCEMSESYPIEALKAQAVAARNYTLKNIGIKHSKDGYDICDTTHCQVYGGFNEANKKCIKAVDDTKGMVMLYNNKLIASYYSGSDGGYTEDSGNVWHESLPYLKAKPDSFDITPWPHGDKKYSVSEIDSILKSEGYINNDECFIKIDMDSITKFQSGRVNSIDIIYKDNSGQENSKTFNKEKARTFLSLDSSLYNVSYDDTANTYTFSGFGHGHGVGLSQIGARNRAEAGQSFIDILKFYYDGVEIKKMDGLPVDADTPQDTDTPTSQPKINSSKVTPEKPEINKQVTLTLETNNSSTDNLIYKYEVFLDGDFLFSKTNDANTFEFNPKSAGSYNIKVSLYDDSDMKKYDEINVKFDVVRNESYSGKNLKVGMSGKDVSSFQQKLKTMGFYNYDKITGYYGNVTALAVKDFQKSCGVSPTGIIDGNTAIELNNQYMKAVSVSRGEKREIPSITFVGLDHSPIIDGEAQSFCIVSKNTEYVQYRVWACDAETRKWEEITDKYTKPVPANFPFKVDTGKTFKRGTYYFSIWVKKAGNVGVNRNSNGDYDSYYAFNMNSVPKDNSKVNLSGDMIMDKADFKLGETIKVNGIKNDKGGRSPYKYKLHVYDITRNKWINNIDGYDDTVSWKPEAEGQYVIDLWAITDSSQEKYDGFKTKIINVIK